MAIMACNKCKWTNITHKKYMQKVGRRTKLFIFLGNIFDCTGLDWALTNWTKNITDKLYFAHVVLICISLKF